MIKVGLPTQTYIHHQKMKKKKKKKIHLFNVEMKNAS